MTISKTNKNASVTYVPKDGASLTLSMLLASCFQGETFCYAFEEFVGGEVDPSDINKFKRFIKATKDDPCVDRVECEIYSYYLPGPALLERKARKKEIGLIVDDDFPNSPIYPDLRVLGDEDFTYYPHGTKVVKK